MTMRGSIVTAARRIPCVSLLLTLPAVALWFFPDLQLALQYDRTAVAAGQFWRFATCHWTHWTAGHLFWDAIMLAALSAACRRIAPGPLAWCLAVSVFAIPLSIWWLCPGLMEYRGLSGLDAALFVLLAMSIRDRSLHSQDRATSRCAILMISLFTAKVLYETATGAAVFVSDWSDVQAVPLAHLAGGLVGLATGGVFLTNTQRNAGCKFSGPPKHA